MGTPAKSRTAATPHAANTSAMHNASVNEVAARQGKCAQVHLPTGRMCHLPHGHKGSCVFVRAETTSALLPRHR
ncbi:MAG TPA: hypothetical protein VIJ15_16030 [Dermatophilaceae bacterium]